MAASRRRCGTPIPRSLRRGVFGGGADEYPAPHRREILQAPRRVDPVPRAHQKTKVEGGRLNKHPRPNLSLAANVDPVPPAGTGRCVKSRSTVSPRCRSNCAPCVSRIRRRLAQVGCCASRTGVHLRRPRRGSRIRSPRARTPNMIVWSEPCRLPPLASRPNRRQRLRHLVQRHWQ